MNEDGELKYQKPIESLSLPEHFITVCDHEFIQWMKANRLENRLLVSRTTNLTLAIGMHQSVNPRAECCGPS